MSVHAPCEITLKRVVSVEVPCQKPWHLDNVTTIGDKEFVVLKHRDCGLRRFVSGKASEFQKDLTFLKDIVRKRTEATAAALAPQAATPFGDVELTPSAKKKARRVAQTKVDRGEMPEWVEVACDRLELPCGMHVGPISIKVKASLNAREAPAVELEPMVLQYIKAAMLLSEDAETYTEMKTLQVRGDFVRWRTTRKCWVGSRKNAKFKHFKPDDVDDPVSIKCAHEKATKWAAGEDVSEAEDEDADGASGESGTEGMSGDTETQDSTVTPCDSDACAGTLHRDVSTDFNASPP